MERRAEISKYQTSYTFHCIITLVCFGAYFIGEEKKVLQNLKFSWQYYSFKKKGKVNVSGVQNESK